MPVVLGGEKSWRTRQLGDLGIAYHWINNEPAMCLYPLRKRIKNAGAYVICLSAAHQYVNSDGHPNINYMIPSAASAAKQMGFLESDSFIIKKVVDAICDGMPDLVQMPPEPPNLVNEAVKHNVGEMTLKLGGKTVVEKEINALDASEMSGVSH